jgi:hypothetical protein
LVSEVWLKGQCFWKRGRGSFFMVISLWAYELPSHPLPLG